MFVLLMLISAQTADAETLEIGVDFVPSLMVQTTTLPLEDFNHMGRHDYLRHSAELAADGLDQLRARVEALPAARRAELEARADFIMNNCPYNRASLQMLITLQVEMADWAGTEGDDVKRALTAHRALLAALGVDELRAPEAGGYLAGQDGNFLTEATLGSNPIAATRVTLTRMMELVDAMPQETTFAALEEARADINSELYGQWAFKSAIMGYNNDLKALAESASDPRIRAEAGWMVEMIDQFVGGMC